MKSPTAAWSTTIALALTTMVYIQWTGIREQGFLHYLKHLAGNPTNLIGWFMVILMLPLNIILELGAVPFSLSLRLFANISSEDLYLSVRVTSPSAAIPPIFLISLRIVLRLFSVWFKLSFSPC
jgi:F-type H+-transporting ATPase subunit a